MIIINTFTSPSHETIGFYGKRKSYVNEKFITTTMHLKSGRLRWKMVGSIVSDQTSTRTNKQIKTQQFKRFLKHKKSYVYELR